jgi:CubicO group peptidase (beta-lactamase class C family)
MLFAVIMLVVLFLAFPGTEFFPARDHYLLTGVAANVLIPTQDPSAKKSIGKKDGAKIVFPGKKWKEKSPLSQGVDPVALDSALNYFDKHSGGCGTREMVIVRNGFIIWKGQAADTLHAVFSCTKIFTSTVMGLLATEGKLEVTDFAEKYMPDITEGNLGQETYKTLRLIHLASMSGGYDPVRTDCWDLHLQGRHEESLECTKGYIIPGKPRFSPGTHWSYRDPEVHLLGHILTSISGKSLYDLFKQGIADKIGMSEWKWSDYGINRQGVLFNNPAGTPNDTDVDDINIFQAGIWITPLDFARLGLLYVCSGKWKGEELLDSEFTRMAITNRIPVETPAIGIDNAGRYGFYWWTNGIQRNGKRPWPSAPPLTSTAHGNGSNFCYVIPEWNMVIVRMSPHNKSTMGSEREETWEGFFSRLKPGIK